jgi:hypothetical protein
MESSVKMLRDTDFVGMAHYYILFDSDLNINHLRLYCVIAQMESHPSPKVQPYFSNQWFADQIGVERRSVIRIANTLKEKGYIKRSQRSDGIWLWSTARTQVHEKAEETVNITSDTQCHPPVTPSVTPPSDTQCHPNLISDQKVLRSQRERAHAENLPSALPESDPFLTHNPHNLDPDKITDYVKTNAIKLAQWKALQEDIDKIVKRGPTAQVVFDIVHKRAWKSVREDFSEIKQIITALQQESPQSDYKKTDRPSINLVEVQNMAEDALASEGVLKYDENYEVLLVQKMKSLVKEKG